MLFDYNLLRKKLPQKRIAIVGDVCLDWYLFIDPERSEESVETGKPTKPVRTSRYSPGGAGNVAANLKSLGVGNVAAFGVVGDDPFAQALGKTLAERGINNCLVTQVESWHTSVYTKLYENEEEDRRIDFGDYNDLADEIASELLQALEVELKRCDLLIINQQLKHGVHTESFRAQLTELLDQFPDLTVITDSRDYPADFKGTIRKLNEREAAVCCNVDRNIVGLADIPSLAEKLVADWRRPVLITRGAHGCVVAGAESGSDDSADGKPCIVDVPGIDAGEGQDIVGAGDAFLAGLSCGLVCDENLESAAYLGNFAAVVTVAKQFQTGTATFSEIEKASTEPTFRYHPVQALADVKHRRYLDGNDVEIITAPPDRKFTCAIFDHDGTISTLRQGWELVMEPMMNEAIRGDASVGPELAAKIEDRVRRYIDVTTGIQTISQMIGLVDLVREFGLVAETNILTPVEYKAIYNEALLDMVQTRTAKYEARELCTDDVTMKGAVQWLELLANAGVRLYLASGTDEEDVVAEANLLGYADYFEDRIYGATGSVTDEPKKRALKRILEDAGRIDTVITFGDGPVEMRETIRRGGYAVGIASDEVRRYGFNESKRRRLVLSGADILIPDFSQGKLLFEMLFGNHQKTGVNNDR